MTFATASQFHVYLPWGQRLFNSVLNVKALVGAFNQKKALVGAFYVIVQLRRLIVCRTNMNRNVVSSVNGQITCAEVNCKNVNCFPSKCIKLAPRRGTLTLTAVILAPN